jgi:hypothetical protein
MKIPTKIRIGGVDYKIIEKECITSGANSLSGNIDYGANEITLATENYGHQFKCVVLLHEILHGIAEHASLDLGRDKEKIIDVFAYGIYQVLQDNGQALFDIQQKIPTKTGKDVRK